MGVTDRMTLDELEEDLELDFFAWGAEKAENDRRRGPFADTMAGSRVIKENIQALAKAIRNEQELIKGGATRDHGTALLTAEASQLALLTLRAILNALVMLDDARGEVTVRRVAKLIGTWCWLEAVHARQKGHDKALLTSLMRRNKNVYNAKSRAKKMLAKFNGENWEKTHLDIKVGGYLIHAAISTTKLFQRHVPKRPGKQLTLDLSPLGRKRLKRLLLAQMDFIAPRWPPMVKPPLPWTGLEGGGYIHPSMLTLVKDMGEIFHAESIEKADLRVPCEAINALQETAWRVNVPVWERIQKAWERKDPAETLPRFAFQKLPPSLPDDAPKADLDRRRYERSVAFRANREAAAHRIEMQMLQVIVGKIGRYVIYFPHQIDWRGRAYPIPQFLHPQGDECSRAILKFAKGKPLGERGAWWLAVHLANCFGEDKIPFQKRVQWVYDNDAAILDSAGRPFDGARLWAKAGKPWRFLAAAMEWAGYRRDGPGFESALPIAMDGTCNGLQHLSALGRDPVGGRWTNLMPGDRPQDIYTEVARQLKEILLAEAAAGEKFAEPWHSLVDRQLVKQPTMTTPYGVSVGGIKNQVRQRMREAKLEAHFPDQVGRAAMYLASRLREAISLVVVRASEISNWLQESVERLAIEANVGVAWITPVGLPVEQRRLKLDLTERVETLAGVFGALIPVVPHEVEPDEQRNGIVPNLIHSLDASHMMLTVNALHARGLRDFAMVHDGYAVHAGDVDVMNVVLRDQFVRVHEEFTLAKVVELMRAAAPGLKMKASPPVAGTLELASVRRSEYFFA